MVKDNVILLEKGVQLPEGIEVGVITQGWWAVGKSSVQCRRGEAMDSFFARHVVERDEGIEGIGNCLWR